MGEHNSHVRAGGSGFFAHGDEPRPPGRLSLSLLSMLGAALVAVVAGLSTTPGLFCSTVTRSSGAHIGDAVGSVVLTAVAFVIVAVIVRNRPRVFVLLLLLAAAELIASIALVAEDSAVPRETVSCGLFDSYSTSTQAEHVWYLYVVWGAALVVLLIQAYRSRSEARGSRPGLVAMAVFPALLLVAQLVGDNSRETRAATAAGPPKGILVCRDPFQAPQVFGGWQCPNDADIGTHPIPPPQGLMCSTDLTDVAGKTIGIRLFYRRRLVKHEDVRNTDSTTNAFAVVSRDDIPGVSPGSLLPSGRYRCRFLVAGSLVRARTFVVKRA